MNKFALFALSLFAVIEAILGDCVIQGIPLWVIGLMGFSFIWMIVIFIKDKVEIKDGY